MACRLFSLKNIAYLIAAGLVTLLSACGGGGNGGPSYPNLSYTGIQTQAVIDQSNSGDFPFVILEGSSGSTNIPIAVSVDAGSSDGIPDPESLKKLSNFIVDKIKNKTGTNSDVVVGATQSRTGTCGGKATTEVNDTGSTVSGTMTFDHYCDGGLAYYGYEFQLHGRMNFSGSYYLSGNTPIFTSLTLNIEYLKFTYNDGVTVDSNEFSGSMSISFDSYGYPTDLKLTINFKYEGKIYKIANFQVDEYGGTISATFYHPDYGYVDVVTTSPFTYNYSTEQFCSGSLQITGNDGVGNPVTIDFTDYSCTTYDICITDMSGTLCSNGNNWGSAPVWP